MITEWIVSTFLGVGGWFGGLVPGPPAGTDPAAGIKGMAAIVSNGLTGLGAWIPWGAIGVIVPISISLYLAGLLLRAIKSFIPTISG